MQTWWSAQLWPIGRYDLVASFDYCGFSMAFNLGDNREYKFVSAYSWNTSEILVKY